MRISARRHEPDRRLLDTNSPIGPNDLLIAATACAQNTILVTHNIREFARVGELATRTENPVEPRGCLSSNAHFADSMRL